jgi:hypothetical protein
VAPRARPIAAQFDAVYRGPTSDQAKRSRRKLSGEDLEALDVDGRVGAGVRHMEVRSPEVLGFVVEHRDDDPVERADARHRPP